jgi:hypothetical protein
MMVTKIGEPFNGSNFSMEHQSENIFVAPQKAESKNYKWKEAPILGV